MAGKDKPSPAELRDSRRVAIERAQDAISATFALLETGDTSKALRDILSATSEALEEVDWDDFSDRVDEWWVRVAEVLSLIHFAEALPAKQFGKLASFDSERDWPLVLSFASALNATLEEALQLLEETD
jgi:hypothetical protein